ncbi:MAG: beta-glucosidase [Cytophagaceae bacterium]
MNFSPNMKYFRFTITISLFTLLFSCQKKSSSTLDFKVDSLLSLMTLEEKIGQMTQINITKIMTDSLEENYSKVTAFDLDTNKLINYITKYHIGSFLNGRGVPAKSWHTYMDQLMKINLKYSRLKIPILYGIDHVHGSSYILEGTIFPHNINIASTFDTIHAYNTGMVTLYETSELQHNWIFAPVMDLGRNKFWGRYYETYGEDPLLASKMGVAYINAIQNNQSIYKAAACAKHFLGYSDPKSGWDRSPAEIPEQTLREFFLPPFKAAIDAGVETIMINSGEVNGIPVHASHEILTKLLREELKFTGVAVTDWMDIIALQKMHYVAENEKEATLMAIKAGIDMSMTPLTTDFCRYVKELVNEGKISEERINQSVRRILKLKFKLGLFNNPYPSKEALSKFNLIENKQKAFEAAVESIVLIKNENILPLPKGKNILLTGPNANRKVPLCGGWTYRFAPQSDEWFPDDMLTLYDAMKRDFNQTLKLAANINELDKMALDADMIVFAAGEETAYAETDGSINDLHLSRDQISWIKKAISTGKPVVLILIEGRPRIISEVFDDCKAVIFAGLPGKEGGIAISEIISGKRNPSGKMSFSYPYKQGHIIPYNYKRSEYSILRPVEGDLKRHAIAEFGHGLSYTTFEYSEIRLSDTIISTSGKLTAEVTVTNTGNMSGKESVLWFYSDEYASITRPIKELIHFEKQELKPGESKTYILTINPEKDLSFPDKYGSNMIEPGYFEIIAGPSRKKFYLTLK